MFDTHDAAPDYGELCEELRCHTTEWLHAARAKAVQEQRCWHLRELAITRVLDERGQIDDQLAGKDKISTRDARRKRRTASRLADLPNIADAAARGELSDQQLDELTDLVDPDQPGDDERWAQQGPSWSPGDLADERRKRAKPTGEDARARRAARTLRWWWRQDHGMLDGRFSLSDVDGALFEAVMNRMIEQMHPAQGEAWATPEHRGADALIHLVRAAHDRRDDPTTGPATSSPALHMIVHVPLTGPATVAGIPLPDSMIERLRAQAKVEPVLVDDAGEPVAVGRTESVLSEKTKRVVRQRDGKCRIPGCDWRHHLEVHHLWPRSWGGTDDISNLAAVCPLHHPQLVPHGNLLLLGNPNNPAGLSLVHIDDLPALAQLAATHARAGPTAA